MRGIKGPVFTQAARELQKNVKTFTLYIKSSLYIYLIPIILIEYAFIIIFLFLKNGLYNRDPSNKIFSSFKIQSKDLIDQINLE